jgi:hypothetical protein
VPEIKDEVVKKIVGMLLHPIPAVRTTAAETLVSVSDAKITIETLVKEDWTAPARELKGRVEEIRQAMEGGRP